MTILLIVLTLCVFQDDASPKFIILAQLVPCAHQEYDTCLKTLKILLNNDRNNVSVIPGSCFTLTLAAATL